MYSTEVLGTYAEVLQKLGRRSAWVVHGAGGMDELSTLGETQVRRFAGGRGESCRKRSHPSKRGWHGVANLDALRGGSAEENARMLVGILSGEIGGAARDLVLAQRGGGIRRGGAGGSPDDRLSSERARGDRERQGPDGFGKCAKVLGEG